MNDDTIVKTVLSYCSDVEAVYTFGSYGTDEERPESDIDIAVLLPHDRAKEIGHIAMNDCRQALADVMGKEVDLINLRRVNTVLQKEIIMNGRIIYQPDETAVDYFEMAVLTAYQKLNEERSEILQEIIRSGRILNV